MIGGAQPEDAFTGVESKSAERAPAAVTWRLQVDLSGYAYRKAATAWCMRRRDRRWQPPTAMSAQFCQRAERRPSTRSGRLVSDFVTPNFAARVQPPRRSTSCPIFDGGRTFRVRSADGSFAPKHEPARAGGALGARSRASWGGRERLSGSGRAPSMKGRLHA